MEALRELRPLQTPIRFLPLSYSQKANSRPQSEPESRTKSRFNQSNSQRKPVLSPIESKPWSSAWTVSNANEKIVTRTLSFADPHFPPISTTDWSSAVYRTLSKSRGIESETFRPSTYIETEWAIRSTPVRTNAAIRESWDVKRGAPLLSIRARTAAGIRCSVDLEFRESGRYRLGVGRSWDAADSVISLAVHEGLGPQDPLVLVWLRTLPNPLQSTPRSLGLLHPCMARKWRSRKSAKVAHRWSFRELFGVLRRPDVAFRALRIRRLLSYYAAKSQTIRIGIGCRVRCSSHRPVLALVPQLLDRRPVEPRCGSFDIQNRWYLVSWLLDA